MGCFLLASSPVLLTLPLLTVVLHLLSSCVTVPSFLIWMWFSLLSLAQHRLGTDMISEFLWLVTLFLCTLLGEFAWCKPVTNLPLSSSYASPKRCSAVLLTWTLFQGCLYSLLFVALLHVTLLHACLPKWFFLLVFFKKEVRGSYQTVAWYCCFLWLFSKQWCNCRPAHLCISMYSHIGHICSNQCVFKDSYFIYDVYFLSFISITSSPMI